MTQRSCERDQGEQVLAGGDVLVDLDALAGDDAVGRSHDFGVAQVELGLIELRLRLLDLGLGLSGAGILRGHLLRTGLGVLQRRLRLRLALVGHAHAVCGGLLAGARIGQCGFGRVGRGHGGVELLLADHVFRDQRLVALQIGLRLGVVGLGLRHARLRGVQLLLRLRHAGLRAAHVGVGRAQIAAGVDGDDGHVDVGRRGIGLGAGQRGLGVLHRNLVVAAGRARRSGRPPSPPGSLPRPP